MSYVIPASPFSENIGVCFTKRYGGFSSAPYDSFNFGLHVGDVEEQVDRNRDKLRSDQQLDSIFWLNQVHGVEAVNAVSTTVQNRDLTVDADASYTSKAGIACAIMVADCMPVLVSNLAGTIVGAAHAGWRGLCAGVISNLIHKMEIDPKDTVVWLGPCIGKDHFEVGEDVLNGFVSSSAFSGLNIQPMFEKQTKEFKNKVYKNSKKKHYLADLQSLARLQLNAMGVQYITASNQCVYSDEENYFSYRRDKKTGRMAALIWIKN